MSDLVQHILEKIELLKNRNGLNDNQIAEGIGITPSGYCRIVNGQRTLKVEFVEKIARFFKVPVLYFFLDHDIQGSYIREQMNKYMHEKQKTVEDIAQNTGINVLYLIDFINGGSISSKEMESLNNLLGLGDEFLEMRKEMLKLLLLDAGIDESKIPVLIEYLNAR